PRISGAPTYFPNSRAGSPSRPQPARVSAARSAGKGGVVRAHARALRVISATRSGKHLAADARRTPNMPRNHVRLVSKGEQEHRLAGAAGCGSDVRTLSVFRPDAAEPDVGHARIWAAPVPGAGSVPGTIAIV